MSPDRTKISPHHTKADLDSGAVTMVEVFENQVQTCVLQFAREIVKSDHSGIAVLMLCCSLLEPLGNMLPKVPGDQSHQNNTAAFCRGCQHVFGAITASDDIFRRLYSFLRCGLYHEAFIKVGLVLSKDIGDPILDIGGTLTVNPSRFLEATDNAFGLYIEGLKRDPAMKAAFDEYFDALGTRQANAHGQSIAVSVPAGMNAVTIAPATPTIVFMEGENANE